MALPTCHPSQRHLKRTSGTRQVGRTCPAALHRDFKCGQGDSSYCTPLRELRARAMETGQDAELLLDTQQPCLPAERAPPGQQSQYRPPHRSPRVLSSGPRAGCHGTKRKVPFRFPSCPEPQHAVKCGEHLCLWLFLLIPVLSLLSHYLLGDAFIAASITTASKCTTGRQKAPKGLNFLPNFVILLLYFNYFCNNRL